MKRWVLVLPLLLSSLTFAGDTDLQLQADGRAALKRIFSEVKVEQPVCFGREYSEKHLAGKPLQKVKKVTAKFSTEPEYNTEYLHVELVLKGEENKFKLYKSMMICQREYGVCSIECDGGRVYLKSDSKSKVQIINRGFIAEGGCGEEGEMIVIEAIKGGDDIFNLVKLPAEMCQE